MSGGDEDAAARTVAQWLAQARSLGVDRLDAQLLLGHASGRGRAWLIAHDDEALPTAQAEHIAQLLAERARGMPLAYLVGEREFHGLALAVGPEVLVPRPETEQLVDWALELLAGPLASVESPDVADLGTGSGAIALAVAQRCPRARVLATDASAAALAVARGNAQRLGLTHVRFATGDWWAAAGPGRFDLVLSNPPYIAGDDPHLAALQHEPRSALTPEGDGLDAIRRIVAGAATHLRPGAWLLLEHGWDQAEAVTALLAAAGLRAVQTRRDLQGHPRCTGAQRSGDNP